MSAKLTLYTNPMSRGRIARWMLEETGASYEAVQLEYGAGMKAPDFLALNPMGKVPTLTHGDAVITETPAICAYLADAFPEAGLAPAIDQRAAYYRWLFFAAGPFEAAVTNSSLGLEPAEDKSGTLGYGSFEAVIDAMEHACTLHDYLTGDAFTAADVYAGSQIGWSMQFGTIEKRPAFEAYWARITDRDAYRRANELDNAAMPDADS